MEAWQLWLHSLAEVQREPRLMMLILCSVSFLTAVLQLFGAWTFTVIPVSVMKSWKDSTSWKPGWKCEKNSSVVGCASMVVKGNGSTLDSQSSPQERGEWQQLNGSGWLGCFLQGKMKLKWVLGLCMSWEAGGELRRWKSAPCLHWALLCCALGASAEQIRDKVLWFVLVTPLYWRRCWWCRGGNHGADWQTKLCQPLEGCRALCLWWRDRQSQDCSWNHSFCSYSSATANLMHFYGTLFSLALRALRDCTTDFGWDSHPSSFSQVASFSGIWQGLSSVWSVK